MPRKTTKYRNPEGCQTINASIAESAYGNPQPQINYTGAVGSHWRGVRAELLRLAAEVEYASIPQREHWIVRVEHDGDYHGRVVLELAEANADEAHRGYMLLREVVGKVLERAAQ